MAEDTHAAHSVFHSIKITGKHGSIEKKIMIDGMELKGVKSATVVWEVNEMPRVFLDIMTTDIEVDEPLAAVLATVPKEEKDDR